MASLQHYHQKRRFTHTPEPKGKRSHKDDYSNHFVVQMHAASHLHYDFRLEHKGVLKSWAVPKGPSLDPNVKRLAVQVEDHPIEYKDFEGIIPKGEYGGGTVMVWDQGSWEEIDDGKSLKSGALTFSLHGEKLKGKWKLIRIKDDPKNWLLIKAKDEEACSQKNYDIVEEEPLSVITGRSLTEIQNEADAVWSSKKKMKKKTYSLPKKELALLEKKKIPKTIKPQLATLVVKPPEGDDWYHEMKFDGYRLLAVMNHEVKLITRGQQDWTDKFQLLEKEIAKLKLIDTIVDGELVAIDNQGLPNFQLLQNSIKEHNSTQLVYYVFDILYYQGYDLTNLELGKRKEILAKIIPPNHPMIRYSDHIQGHGKEVFKKAEKLGFEGIVSKNIHSPYLQKRGKNWLKIKVNQRQEFIVGGFTKPEGERNYIGALLLGQYDKKGQLQYCGRVGTGFTEASLKELYNLFKENTVKKCPFLHKPPASDVFAWLQPTILVEVEFKEWTEDGLLRHASFKGVRSDKEPIQVTKETPDILYPLTHPDKILYPKGKITKQDIAQYYQSIQQWILPHLCNRPLNLLRCPEGIEGEHFYQKHILSKKGDNLNTITIQEKTKKSNYIYIKDIAGLIQLVQINVLEIHPWNCRIDNIDKPDYLTFDLDPGEDVTWKMVVKAAFHIKDELESFALQSFIKTTGGKGLHIVIPIQRRYDWEMVVHFSQTFAKYLALKYPQSYIDNMSKAKRKGKIFIDYLRNHRGATAVAAYSLRAREEASISTPLSWEELSPKIPSNHYTIKNIQKRLDKLVQDPWQAFFSIKQKLPGIDELKE